jgi:hypothetical protein
MKAASSSLKAISDMVAIVQTDIGKRGIKKIFPDNNPASFHEAAKQLIKARRIAVLTGFSCIIDSEPHIETDGIAGAFAIANSMALMGRHVTILMDKHCEEIMNKVCEGYFKPELRPRVDL